MEATDEFIARFVSLTEPQRKRVTASVDLLVALGVTLGDPHTSTIESSRHPHMRELKVQVEGRPFRVLYAFDPRRTAILLIGGDKTGDNRFYERIVPIADRLYDEHLAALGREKEE